MRTDVSQARSVTSGDVAPRDLSIPGDVAEVVNGEVVTGEAVVTPDRPGTREWLMERIDGWVAVAVGVTWLVIPEIAAAIEPAPQRSEPLIGVLLAVVMWSILIVMACGLVARRRWGLVASLGGAAFATMAAIACPVSGHHQFGTWWYGEMACMLALVGVSVAALSRAPAAPESAPKSAPYAS